MHLLNNLLSFDPSLIKTGFNIALFVIIAIIIIGGIIGLVRGVWNSTFRLLFVGTLVVLSFVFSKQIAESLSTLNIGSLFGNIQINMNGATIQVTTLKETVVEVVKSFASGQPGMAETINDPETIALIESVAMMIIRFITLIILGIFVFLIGDLILAPLLYHLLFKFLIPSKVRKKVKLRVVGMFEGLVKTTLVAGLLITPFSSILNTLNRSMQNGDDSSTIDNALYNEIMSWVNAYNESYFAQVLFNWTADSNGNTFDVNLVNYATADGDLAFNNELSAIGDIASAILKSGGVSSDGSGFVFDLSVILNSELVSTIVAQLTDSALVMNALPIAASIAMQMDVVKQYLDTEKIDLDNLDWEQELTAIDTIYSAIYDSGVVEDALKDKNAVVSSLFKDGKKQSIQNALKSIDDSPLLSMIIPAVLYKMAGQVDDQGNPASLGLYLPTDWDDYKDIKFGSELSLIYGSTFEVNKATNYALIDSFMQKDTTTKELAINHERFRGFIRQEESEEPVEETKTPIELILNNIDSILPHIVGRLDENGNPVTDEDGLSLEADGECLLDSKFLYKALDKIIIAGVDLITANIKDATIDKDAIKDILNDFTNLQAYKKEFGALLNVSSSIMTNDKLSGVMTGGNIDIQDSEVRDELKSVLPTLDNSLIMSEILPSVIEPTIATYNSTLAPYGISTDDFDFRVDNFGSELSTLLDAIGYVDSLSQALDKPSTAEKIAALNPDDVEHILDIFHDSKILNPHVVVDEEIVVNKNFFKIVDYIFAIDGIEIANITGQVTNIEDVQWTREKDNLGNDVYGENYHLAQFFTSVKSDDIIKLITTPDVPIHDENQFASSSIETLFAKVDESILLSSSFGAVLDRTILPLLSMTSDEITFTNVTDWTNEGANLKSVIDGLQDINKAFGDISWLDENTTYVNDILKNFSKSQAFGEDGFSNFIFKQMKTQMPDYLKDYPNIDEPTYVMAQQDFQNIENWENEIDHVTDLIADIQALAPAESSKKGTDGLDRLSNDSGSLSKTEIETTLNAVNDCDSMRLVMVNALDSIVNDDTLNIAGLTLSDTNVACLLEMNKLARSQEITHLSEAYGAINEMGLKEGLTLAKINGADTSIMLTAMHDSHLFNTKKIVTQDLTVYEQVIKTITVETNFSEKIVDEGQTIEEKIKTIENNYASTEASVTDGWIGENGEISRLCEIINAFKETGIESFTLDEAAISSLLESDEKVGKLDNLLQKVNDSELFYRGLPNMLDEAISSNVVNVEGMNLDMTKINTDYNHGAKYDAIEITKFTSILKTMNEFNDIKDGQGNKIENPNLGDFDVPTLNRLLNQLHDSKMFNTVKGVTRNETFFENVIATVLVKGEIDQKIIGENRTLTDIIFNIGNNLTLTSETDGWITTDGEIARLCDILTQFQSLGLADADLGALDNLTQEQTYDALYAINISRLCYRSVPAYIDELIQTQTVDGVDLSAANSYYNGDSKYDDSEIDSISKIYASMNKVNDFMSSLLDFSSITDETLTSLSEMLNNLADSQIFHLAGSDVTNVNTVFEQIMIKLFADSTLEKMIYDTTLYPSDATTTAHAKSVANIVAYSASNKLWSDEIDHLMALITCVKDNAEVSNPNEMDLATLNPTVIGNILHALNNGDLTFEAVPVYTKKAFTSINIGALSQNKETYIIGREQYKTREISTITSLLDGIKSNDGSYPNFQNFEVVDFINGGLSITPILTFLDESVIFGEINGLVFYNAINTANFGQYIRTDYNALNRTVFSELFDKLDAQQIIAEGNALNSILTKMSTLEGIDLSQDDINIDGIVELYRLAYSDVTKYMFAGEILCGFMSRKLVDSGLIQDGYHLEWFKESDTDFMYPLLNDVEANGLKGILNSKKIANIDIQNVGTINLTAFDDCFAIMETNGTNSTIAMAIYVKSFYTPFKTSLQAAYDNRDLVFFGNEEAKTLFVDNYLSLNDNPFDSANTFSFIAENNKIKNCLTALKMMVA